MMPLTPHAKTLFFDSFYFYISVKNKASAMLTVTGKFNSSQQWSFKFKFIEHESIYTLSITRNDLEADKYSGNFK